MTVDPNIVNVLKSAELFGSFTETGIQIVASIAQDKLIPAGAPLFVENMIGDGLYVIGQGGIRLAVRGTDGRDIELGHLGAGASLGEAALLRAGPRLCSATAEIETRVVEITRRDLAQLQRSKPQACIKLMMAVVERVGRSLSDSGDDMRRFLAWQTGHDV